MYDLISGLSTHLYAEHSLADLFVSSIIMTNIGEIIVLLILVNTSTENIDENYLQNSMQSPVVKSYERHLNEVYNN
uniref:CPXV160 protein n=1 Tax=Ascaris lumbricoides TaxID=6252 RepID=A0A0M3IF29_ASCLU